MSASGTVTTHSVYLTILIAKHTTRTVQALDIEAKLEFTWVSWILPRKATCTISTLCVDERTIVGVNPTNYRYNSRKDTSTNKAVVQTIVS